MNLVTCRGLTRRYGAAASTVTAVDDVDLDISAGEFVAIEGPSGSGKTTLLGLLAGLEAPDEGAVTVLGHDLARLSAAERARLRQRRIGIVFQSFGLIASLSAGENVALPLRLAGVDDAGSRARATQALEEVGLGGSSHARVDELSGGERQRVGVARALVIEPSLVLADEPTGSLDDENARGILTLLAEAVRRRDAGLVLVTHDPGSAGLASRRLRMLDGRLYEGIPA